MEILHIAALVLATPTHLCRILDSVSHSYRRFAMLHAFQVICNDVYRMPGAQRSAEGSAARSLRTVCQSAQALKPTEPSLSLRHSPSARPEEHSHTNPQPGLKPAMRPLHTSFQPAKAGRLGTSLGASDKLQQQVGQIKPVTDLRCSTVNTGCAPAGVKAAACAMC